MDAANILADVILFVGATGFLLAFVTFPLLFIYNAVRGYRMAGKMEKLMDKQLGESNERNQT